MKPDLCSQMRKLEHVWKQFGNWVFRLVFPVGIFLTNLDLFSNFRTLRAQIYSISEVFLPKHVVNHVFGWNKAWNKVSPSFPFQNRTPLDDPYPHDWEKWQWIALFQGAIASVSDITGVWFFSCMLQRVIESPIPLTMYPKWCQSPAKSASLMTAGRSVTGLENPQPFGGFFKV